MISKWNLSVLRILLSFTMPCGDEEDDQMRLPSAMIIIDVIKHSRLLVVEWFQSFMDVVHRLSFQGRVPCLH